MKQSITLKNGAQLSYAEYGDRNGFPILIQHGLIASIEDDVLFAPLIEAGYRLVCIARPGYGRSSPCLLNSFAEWAELAAPLIGKLGLDRFDVLGMSSGAPYSYAIGSRFRQRVRNIYIFSGIPALYDEVVLSYWPYPPIEDRSMSALQDLAQQLFFSGLKKEDREQNDIRDSMMNHGFGVAQDLRLRFMDWGFSLADIKTPVYMRHSKTDDSIPFQAAVRTSELLPNCQLELTETGPHFSSEALDLFIKITMMDTMKRTGESTQGANR